MQIRKFIEEKAGHTITMMRPAGALLLTLAAALAFWLFLAAIYHKEAIDDISKSLITINSYKRAQISEWLGNHRREALRLGRHPFLGEILSRELSNPGSKRASLITWLSDHTAQKRYSAMAFVSAEGAVIAGTPGYKPGTEPYFKKELTQTARTGAARLTDLYLGADGLPRLTMFSPITAGGRGGKPLCVLAIQIDPATEFYPLLTATPLLFTRAETLLVRKEGEFVLFLNELEQAKDSALKLRRPLSETGLPAAAVLTGRTGFFAGKDYRGEKVFSALDRIEASHWAVITKIDRSTVLGPVKLREYLTLVLILLAAALIYGFVYAVILGREWTGREKLREGERRLAALFSNLPGVAFRCANTRDWSMEFLSEGCLGLTGYPPEELIGNPVLNFNELIAPQDRERVWSTIQGSLAESGKYKVAYSLKCKDGSFKSVWEQGVGVKGPGGAFEKLEGFISDITPLKRAQQALQISEQIFREFMEHSPIYVFFKDENIRPMHLSRNYESMLGRPLDQLLGKSMDELFPSELAKNMVADDMRILKEGKEVSVEEQFNGRTYRTIKFPIMIEGRPPYLAGYTIDITEQKQALEKIDRMNESLARLTEQVPGVVYQYRLYPDGRSSFPYASSGISEIYEVTPEEVREDATPVFGRIHPEDLKATSAAILESARDNSIFHWEFRVVLPRQGLRWRLCDARPERLPDGSTLWYGIITDITGRKHAEESLTLNVRHIQTMLQLNQMTEATEKEITDFALEEIVRLTQSKIGYLAFLNADESVLTMHSWSRSAMAECAISDKPIIYPVKGTGLWGEAVRQRRAVITNDYAAPDPAKKGCPRGHVALTRHMNAPVFSGGRIVIVAGVGNKTAEYDNSDVEQLILVMGAMWRLLERRRAVEALRQSGALMKSTQELARIGGWEWDLAAKTMHWTEETYRIHDFVPENGGPPPEKLIARSEECYRPEDRPVVMAAFNRCAETGEPYDLEFPFTTAKGRSIWIRTTARAENKDGKITKLTGTLSDITEKKQAELELKRINQDLFSKKQEMENFLYITTHDLRSPLVNIQGFSQNLERYIKELLASVGQAPLSAETRQTLDKLAGKRIPEALTYVQESSRKMDALISALLKVSRMGRVEMKPEILEVNGLLQTILDSLRYQLEEAGGKIEVGTLPRCRADRGAVNQLFTNLLDNAIKYRHKARPLVVRVTGEVKGTSVLYTVADNGAGIPQGDLSKIWDIFFRPRGAGDNRGEGIGLPMVRRIAERNGGGIKAESEEGEGSVFYVELPGPGEA